MRRKISIIDNCQSGSRIKMRFHGVGKIISENPLSGVEVFADIGNILSDGQRWPQRISANTKAITMTKRQSTTAKLTRATASLIRRYILATGSGVMVRHRGVECGVTRVFDFDGDNRAKSTGFLFHDRPCTRAIHCTISKATLAALQTWANRTDGLGRLVLIDCEDGTVGNAGGRYVVSEPNGLVFDDQPLECPSLATFADDTLGAETVGVWRDGGKVYVDSNRSFDRLSDALEFGRSSGQLAIYDTVDSVCIDC